MDRLGDCLLTDWLIDMLSDCWLIHCFIIDWLISWLAVAWLTDCWLISRPVVDWLVGCLQTHGHSWGQHSCGNPSGCWGVGQASHCYCHTWPVQSGAYPALSVCPVLCVPCSLRVSVFSLVCTLLSLSLCPVWCIPCCLCCVCVCQIWCVPWCLSLCVQSGVDPAGSLSVSSLVHTLLSLSLCVQSGAYPAVSLCVQSGVYPAVCVCVSSLVGTLLSLCVCPVWCIPCCLSVSSLVCTLLSLSLCGWPLLYWILLLLWLDLVCPKTHLLYFMYMWYYFGVPWQPA